ncbi:M23 family metallopeptidase [Pedobacter duraquae]|uniref:Murein DD-endopeptidase MepM/ murein hydrolase activator NlpD n=1 Tax=Pedobacter duraquae TaxID=425511 RepID=A0A4R6IC78_9SPHI|nr:M23 family metallopeptidase [Pedobacter duraquae]TDO19088.1 murein DD-endopeptidase MepM/ murein hydrolase activator NlpD [Pedobacter duraquae]
MKIITIKTPQLVLCGIAMALFLNSCKTAPLNLFKTGTPHELYQRKLSAAGLDHTAMGRAWISASSQSLTQPSAIRLPYRESGYFAAERIPAVTYSFDATRGQQITLQLSKTPATDFMIYVDIWMLRDGNSPKRVAAADTLNNPVVFEADQTAKYMLRLQPELLKSGSYTLEITTGPSLKNPIKAMRRNQIQSYWGDGRDANARRHEGVDIFSTFRTPVLASAPGTITRVNENTLGGKVVFLHPSGKDYSLYYAHLDEQLAREGQQVTPGDTLGFMGNTGNARTTPPHLHFGIYTNSGAIDPLPFIDPAIPTPAPITAALAQLNATSRTAVSANLTSGPERNSQTREKLAAGTIVHIDAAAAELYKVSLPDGRTGFLRSRDLNPVLKAIRKIKLSQMQQQLFDQPANVAAVKKNLNAGATVDVLGSYQDFYMVRDATQEIGWVRAN